MVEYAYCYPRNYEQSNQVFINLNNIKNDSLMSYASAENFRGTSLLNISYFEDVSLPEEAEIVNRYIEVATEAFIKKGDPNLSYTYIDGLQRVGAYSIGQRFRIDKLPENRYQPGRFEFSSKDISSVFELRIYYIRLVIEYEVPNFAVNIKRVDHNNLLNQVTGLNINISNLNMTSHNTRLIIDLPEGVELSDSDRTVQLIGRSLVWVPKLSKSEVTDSLNLRFSLLSLGVKTFSVNESYHTGGTKTVSFTVVKNIEEDTPEEDNKGVPISVIKQGSVGLEEINNTIYQIGYDSVNITVRCDDNVLEVLDYITFTDSEGLCETITPHTDSDFVDNTTVFDITPEGAGSTDLQIEYQLTVDGVSTVYKAQHYVLNVLPETLTYPFFTVLKLTDEELCRLGDHINYTVQTYMKITNYDTGFGINDWIKNYRIGVYNPEEVPEDFDITNLTLEEIFDGVVEWSGQPSRVNEYDNIECTFTYHKENPLYIVITGDYEEGNTTSLIDYSIPAIVESSVYTGYENMGNFPIPIDGLINDDVGSSSVDVTKFNQSNTVVLSDFGLDDGFGTNEYIGVTGVEINLECEYNDIISVLVRLKSPTGKVGQRSVVLNEGVSNITLGGPYDTFGFDVSELVNLEDFQIEVQANNFFNNVTNIANLKVHNASLTFYFNKLDEVLVNTYIDGTDIRYYGLFLEDVEMPEGLNTDTKYLEIDGSDSHDSYRQNIDKKEIKLTLSVEGCTIYDTSEMLRNITKLFQNKRDELNKPIPKTIEFSNKPGMYWEYIMEESIETSFEAAQAELKITLIVPAGTGFSKEETVTNVTGGVTGIAKVNPIIVVIPLGDHVELLETNSQQKFSINYDKWSSENIVEIDCINREVTLTSDSYGSETVDISGAVDFSSDWFILDGDYTFEPINCIIQSVTFKERW